MNVKKHFCFLFLLLTIGIPVQASANVCEHLQEKRPTRPRAYKLSIVPHWFNQGKEFWYRNDLSLGRHEFIRVDAESGNRHPAFDHKKLAHVLGKEFDKEYLPEKLPFRSIRFVGQKLDRLQFEMGKDRWCCDLGSYELTKVDDDDNVDPSNSDPNSENRTRGRQRRRSRQRRNVRSPDGTWTATIRENNLCVRTGDDGDWKTLSEDGTEERPYRFIQWSPDSSSLMSFRYREGENKEVHLIESSPRLGGRAKLKSRRYPLPGDRFASYEINLFSVESGEAIRPKVDLIDFGFPRVRWDEKNHRLLYQQVDRGHQRFRLISINLKDGEPTVLIEEKSDTFIWTVHFGNRRARIVNWLEQTDELIYVSERDGWRHLYLVDSLKSENQHQITRGEFVVRNIEYVDEKHRQIWFTASGMKPGQDPYLIHYYRINFDGTGLMPLTEGNGNHSLQFSPDRKFAIDTYSRVDMPPVHELRRTSDGKKICDLETADIGELQAAGFRTPEVFSAKGRDGETDIWGIITVPKDLDPSKKYPVVEYIYAGPHDSHVPKSFRSKNGFDEAADRGYILVQIDGMGTANRSKAFHDVCWKNLKDAGFPDRILWMKEAAKTRPYMDLDRVGIFGTSAGGQNAAGAVLFHPDFYKVASANCGCHDNRMDKASWNEQWMGYPVGPHYAECSNIDNAHRLQGHLQLIIGELDTNVPPESTYRLCDALIKANKDFELIYVPGGGHGAGQASRYLRRRLWAFFDKHLRGVDFPNQNATRPESRQQEKQQASQPPEKESAPQLPELRQELAKRVQQDQAVRKKMIRFKELDQKKRSELISELLEIDQANTKWLKQQVEVHGWLGETLVGKSGAHDAWLLVQHADKDRAFQAKCLQLMQKMPPGEVSLSDVAYLTDRVLVAQDKPQRFGTQCDMVNGKPVIKHVEDRANLNQRRKKMGLSTIEEYLKLVEKAYSGNGD